jgi:hypothetical protein
MRLMRLLLPASAESEHDSQDSPCDVYGDLIHETISRDGLY